MDKRKKNFRRYTNVLAQLLASVTRRAMRSHFTDLQTPLSKLERDNNVAVMQLREKKIIADEERRLIW